MSHQKNGQQKSVIRCAIYTRKSTEEGLEQDFNTLDAQREAGEAFIRSQQHEGWNCLAQRYDDGGFSGANIRRPALTRLLSDIEAGRVDCIVVYKVDRLSRSLLDFSQMLELFERQDVSFVSVTQQFNTTHSMGRLTLNILLSFAQFEREIISERTRDKVAAARRKGKWSGGLPMLGYDVQEKRLVVNQAKAGQVRKIFQFYCQQRSLLRTVELLQQRGWHTKRWTTRRGQVRGGRPFDKTNLHSILTNPIYTGQVRHQGKLYPGEHESIIEQALFDQVQEILRSQRMYRSQRRAQRNAPLSGLLRCAACQAAMTLTYTQRGTRRYRYYVCMGMQKRGRTHCACGSLPAAELERFVIEQINHRAGQYQSEKSLLDFSADLGQANRPELTSAMRRYIARIEYDGRENKLRIQWQDLSKNPCVNPSVTFERDRA